MLNPVNFQTERCMCQAASGFSQRIQTLFVILYHEGLKDDASVVQDSYVVCYWFSVRAKLHYTDPGYEHRLRTPPTDELTTIVQQILPHRNARAQHLDMSRCWDVAIFCPLVVFVAGVRVVEFGSKRQTRGSRRGHGGCGKCSVLLEMGNGLPSFPLF